MSYRHLLVQRDGATARVTLNRPEVHNALNDALIGELRDAFQERYPRITVQIDDSPGDWHEKLVTQAASGAPPDAIFECDCALGGDVRRD